MHKGIYHHSEETKKKMSRTRLGYKPSIESRIKHSMSISGEKNHNWGKPKSPETKAKLRLAHLGNKNAGWKGGRRFDNFGYIKILNHAHPHHDRDGYVLEHRLIVEKQIGRYLKPKEVCHHINKIKDDNRPENLMAFRTHGIHLRFERNCPTLPEEVIFNGRSLHIKVS